MEIRATETSLQAGGFHEQDVRNAMKQKYAKGGTVWVRDHNGGFAPWTIPSFADKWSLSHITRPARTNAAQ